MTFSTFGETFRCLREQRGIKRKEAAGSIVSQQHLGQFENNKSNMTIEVFNRLLISIGATWEDFLLLYDGDAVMNLLCTQVTELNQMQLTGEYHTLPNLLNKLTIDVPDNPNLPLLMELATELVTSARKDNLVPIDPTDPKFLPIFNHFDRIETWGTLEQSLFYQCLRLFDAPFVDMHIHQFLDKFEKNPPKIKENWSSSLTIALYCIPYFSKKNEFAYAEKLINRLELMLKQDSYTGFWDEKFSLLMFKSSTLVRQGKAEGLDLARTVVQTYQLFGEHFYSPYAITHLNNFIDFIHSINKTGLTFNPY